MNKKVFNASIHTKFLFILFILLFLYMITYEISVLGIMVYIGILLIIGVIKDVTKYLESLFRINKKHKWMGTHDKEALLEQNVFELFELNDIQISDDFKENLEEIIKSYVDYEDALYGMNR